MEIQTIRTQIDKTDREIVSLLVRRMNLCAEIADCKAKSGLPVRDETREEELLANIAQLSGAFSPYMQNVYREILSQSRAYQSERMAKKR